MTLIMKSAFSLTSNDWSTQLSPGVRPYFLRGLYGERALWSKHVSPELLIALEQQFNFSLPQISGSQAAQDGTIKFQLRFHDGLEAETVLIPFHKRYSVCLSSQVGCGMNCSFCFTGTQGLKRNLEAGEIVGQYLVALNWLRQKDPLAPLPSIVFMGQGEPLHNVTEVKQAIAVLNDPSLLGVGHRLMTLSTVGYLPHIPLLKDFPRINLALSLHSPFEEERARLIPLEKRFPLTEVLAALDQIPLLKRQFINYEYLLIKNFNMTESHAKELQRLLGARPAIMNLIPFNPFPGSTWQRPDAEEVEEFRHRLVEKKLRVMVRTTKGHDILAACGQLKIEQLARNNGNQTRRL
jgi:23S rRNA (adenine2503-C2)-methyltransferase